MNNGIAISVVALVISLSFTAVCLSLERFRKELIGELKSIREVLEKNNKEL